MPTYRVEQIEELLTAAAGIPRRATDLVETILAHNFQTPKAIEFSNHGLARRIQSMGHSIGRVYEVLPPDLQGLPDRDLRIEATVHIQSVVIHVYGCFDNLAQIWVAENGIRRANGTELPLARIGFSSDKIEVIQSLPQSLQADIQVLSPWFKYLEEFRHSTAHRMPLYIPPFAVDPNNADSYAELGRKAAIALECRDFEVYDEMKECQRQLCFFRPMHSTSIYAGKTALFHPQLIADFAAVEKWTNKLLDALRRVEA